ncbi:MAG TPA: hypothetical protein VL069_15050, partial [Opitutus sp.]|nr:hypothetical protein [Opitutus sp.]
MKDSKFIELLNLYIDHQISAADAALLESEIQKNPERRRVYRQYCQMQKACVTLAENFRSDPPAGDKLVEIAQGPRRMAFATYAMGIAAAAACVALVVVNRPVLFPSNDASPTIATTEITSSAQEVTTAIAETPAAEARTVLHPAFPGVTKADAPTSEVVATADHVPLDWMHQVRLESVSAENLWFDTRPAIQAYDLTLRSARPSEA